MKVNHRMIKNISLVLCALFFQSTFATSPRTRSYNSRVEFERGKLENIAITDKGRVMPAPEITRQMDTGDPFVWAMLVDGKGHLFIGTGNDGRVYRINAKGDSTIFFDAPELQIYALALDEKNNLYAASSPNGKVYRITPEGKSSVFFDPQDQYIWDLALDRKGNLWVATGESAKIYKISTDGASQVILENQQTHIRQLEIASNGMIFAGTSGPGYIYRIQDGAKPFVIFDTQMMEVHALAISSDGLIYAAAYGQAGPSIPVDLRDKAKSQQTEPKQESTTSETILESQQVMTEEMLRTPKTQTALFKMDTEGNAKDLWTGKSEPVQYLLPAESGDLLVGTGDKGKLYRMNSLGDLTLFQQLRELQITALARAERSLYLGTSNMGRVYRLGPELSPLATYLSETLDSAYRSKWGVLQWDGSSESSAITFLTRSGNTEQPGESWSDWQSLQRSEQGGYIQSPAARFLQWKCEFKASPKKDTFIDKVTISYQQENLPPVITSIIVHPPGNFFEIKENRSVKNRKGLVYPQPLSKNDFKKGFRSVDWLFEDPNFDALIFDIAYRRDGDEFWKTLETDYENSIYSWDTTLLQDGKYTLKITAKDGLNNPESHGLAHERESESFIIDNTGPAISEIQINRSSRQRNVTFTASDQWNSIKRMEYSINGGDWKLLFPLDGINDSRKESYQIALPELETDSIDLAIRASDSLENSTIQHHHYKK